MHEVPLERLAEETASAIESGDHVRALALADQLVARRPNHYMSRLLRCRVLSAMGKASDAFAEAQRAVELAPALPEVRWQLAATAWDVGKLGLAQQSLERAVALSRRSPVLLAEYAWFMASARGPRLGEQSAHEAIGADGQSATAWAALGMAQFRLHQLDDARASLNRALQLDPNSTAAQYAMVLLLQVKKEDAKAGALASVLQDTTGAEDFAKAARKESRLREMQRSVLEREAVQESMFREPAARRWGWLIVVAVALGLVGLMAAAGWSCVGVLLAFLFIVWRVRTLFDV